MASTINLSRNTKVYLTTNVDAVTGVITDAAASTCTFTATASTTNLTVSAIGANSAPITVGMLLSGGSAAPGSIITGFTSGTAGGAGVYTTNINSGASGTITGTVPTTVAFTAAIGSDAAGTSTGTVMTASAITGGQIYVGMNISGSGVIAGTRVTAITSTSSGTAGVFTITPTQAIPAGTSLVGNMSTNFSGVVNLVSGSTTATVESVNSGSIVPGMVLKSADLPAAGVTVVAFGTGTGLTGTYILSAAASATASGETVSGVTTGTTGGFTSTNTYEIQVLDGYSFSQTTNQTSIQVSEAGATPSRGQRAFNTSLAPVEFSFSTYIRPALVSNYVTAAEKVLWNALLGPLPLDTNPAGTGTTTLTGITRTVGSSTATVTSSVALAAGSFINIGGASGEWNQAAYIPTAIAAAGAGTMVLAKAPSTASGLTPSGAIRGYTGQWAPGGSTVGSYASSLASNVNQLQKFGMVFVVDNVVYLVDNCALDQASVDFGLDAISMIAWTGKGTVLKQAVNVNATTFSSGSLVANISANYITNKLSTMTLQSNIGGEQYAGSTSYTIPITGGNITIANNLNYLTPTNLGVVNNPVGYYTGQRAISGNVTAYLRTGGTTDAGALLKNLLTGANSTTEPKFFLQLDMGGSNQANRVEFELPAVVLQIPAVNVADIVATTINFNAQGFNADVASNQAYDITNANEISITYFSA
jgi:hypothetical protein